MEQANIKNTSTDVPRHLSVAPDRSAQTLSSKGYDLDSLIQDLDSTVPEAKTLREKIELIEAELLKLPQEEMCVRHFFADGIYARELFIPKGTILTGEIYKSEHLNVCSKGEITVLTEDGVKKIKAPWTILSRPGTKKVGYAHEDTIWTTIHATKETDLEKLKIELYAKDFEDPELIKNIEFKRAKESACQPLLQE